MLARESDDETLSPWQDGRRELVYIMLRVKRQTFFFLEILITNYAWGNFAENIKECEV
jgi:hypothetical protein